MSPFCVDFESTKDLLSAYIAYCPKSFSYNGSSDIPDLENSTEEKSENNEDKNVGIAARLRCFTKSILSENDDMEPEEALEYGIAGVEGVESNSELTTETHRTPHRKKRRRPII